MLFKIFIIITLFFIISWIMGKLLFILCFKSHENDEALFIGFFIYFGLFQVIALPLILTFKPLSYLSTGWAILILICFICAIILFSRDANKFKSAIKKGLLRRYVTVEGIIMLVLVILQTYLILVHIYNAWDTVYYIANVNTSIYTNSMYVYDGSSGIIETKLNIRYALSSFYMHDAVIGQIFDISGILVCKYFNRFVCSIFSAYIAYKIGLILFKKDKWANITVAFWVLLNLKIISLTAANHFLIYRAYESKAFCANIIIPAIIYIYLKIYLEGYNKRNWIFLLIVNISGGAISGTALYLLPVLNVCLVMGHCLTVKNPKDIGKTMITLLPNIIYMLIFLLDKIKFLYLEIPA